MAEDAELLRTEIELLFGLDSRGRVDPPHHLVLGVPTSGSPTFAPGPDLPDDIERAVRAALGPADPGPPDRRPQAFGLAGQLLAERGIAAAAASGPTYLVPSEAPVPTSDAEVLRSDAEVLRSDAGADAGAGDVRAGLAAANPGNWEQDEWCDLVAGRLGPWAMATRGERVVAIAHLPVWSDVAADIGVWTHPAYRGRRYAGLVTTALQPIVTASGRRLFYSTSADNHASQRVAAGLGLPLVGWLWRLSPPDAVGRHRRPGVWTG